MTTLVLTADYRVAAGEQLTFANDYAAIFLQEEGGPAPNLLIQGSVNVTMTALPSVGFASTYGIQVGAGGYYNSQVTIEAGGALRVSSTIGQAFGFSSGSWSPEFLNRGVVEVTAKGRAVGLESWDGDVWTFENQNTFKVTSTHEDALGVDLANGGLLRNSGTIDVSGAGAVVGVRLNGWDSSFANSGVIRARDTAGSDSVAVLWTTTMGPNESFVNSGVIEAAYALKVEPYAGSLAADLFTNSGSMIGKVALGPSSARLANSGEIHGDVDLGAGDDTYDGARGIFLGVMEGGEGADSLSGGVGAERFSGGMGADSLAGEGGDDALFAGAGADSLSGGAGRNLLRGEAGDDLLHGGVDFDDLHGNQGADTLWGGQGDDWVVGGQDNDLLHGQAGIDVVHGSRGADTLLGGDDRDVMRGGQDGDSLSGDGGDDFLSGDRGADTISGGAGADTFHIFQGAGLDRVTDFSYAEGDRVAFETAGVAYTARQEGGDTVIDLGSGDQMVLVGVNLSTLPSNWVV